MLPKRQKLPHGIPPWVENGSEYFVTVCTQPKGINQLCNPKTYNQIRESLLFRQNRGDLWIHLLLLMPDHLHAIMSFSPMVGMEKTMNDWKRYTCVNGGISWQRDFFDHRLRRDESYVEKAHYIRMNPVRAGLITEPEDWPYVWENIR
jgi:putative transposase